MLNLRGRELLQHTHTEHGEGQQGPEGLWQCQSADAVACLVPGDMGE